MTGEHVTSPARPTLEEASKRNPAMVPERVRQMQQVVKQLQDRGVLNPPRYGIQPALGGAKGNLAAASHSLKMANRVASA